MTFLFLTILDWRASSTLWIVAATRRVRSLCPSSSPLHSTGYVYSCQFRARFFGFWRGLDSSLLFNFVLNRSNIWYMTRSQIILWGVWFLLWQLASFTKLRRFYNKRLQSLQLFKLFLDQLFSYYDWSFNKYLFRLLFISLFQALKPNAAKTAQNAWKMCVLNMSYNWIWHLFTGQRYQTV